jgi:hypothetical protein
MEDPMATHMMTSAAFRLMASSLGLLLISCSVTRHATTAPAGADELPRFALIINEMSDGQTIHSWQRLEELDLSRYPSLPSRPDTVGQPVRAAWTRDCERERDECEDDCMRSRVRPGYGHVTTPDRKRGAKYDFCRQKCMQPYLDCCRLRELEPQRFTEPDDAVGWLKRHHKEILLGSVIVIAGVVFVTVSAGAGALVLVPIVPAVVMASSGLPAEPSTPAVSP